jgi:chaperone required for assembly of F1-ATPase
MRRLRNRSGGLGCSPAAACRPHHPAHHHPARPPAQPAAGLDRWRLAVLDDMVGCSKSLVVAAALLAGRLPVAGAVAAARVEEDYQMEEWGCVEAGHDLDIADLRTRVAAAATLVRLLG